jgi:hypothetical protein
MKRISLTSLLCIAFVIIPNAGSYIQGMTHKTREFIEISYVLETLTVYNPTVGQCDKTPLITASNAKIDLEKLGRQELRWMALSRDLLKRWKGNFSYGDTVRVVAGDPQIDGLWIIQDNLNRKYKNRGDLLFDSRIRTLGKWKNVKISKITAIG